MLKNNISEVLNYIDNNLMDDIHDYGDGVEGASIKIFPLEDLKQTYDYVLDLDKETRDDYLLYLCFTPYKDFELKVIEEFIEKYPFDGYEENKAAYFLDIDPNKTLEICESIKDKYKDNYRILKRIKHLEQCVNKKGE